MRSRQGLDSLAVAPEPYESPESVALVNALYHDIDERYADDGGEDAEGYGKEVTMADVTPPAGVFLVARLDGQPVGCGALRASKVDDALAEIKRMYVVPEFRGRGISRAILSELVDTARRSGYPRIRLETGTKQPEAVALYQSAGWSRIPSYGPYADSEWSMCFALDLTTPSPSSAPD